MLSENYVHNRRSTAVFVCVAGLLALVASVRPARAQLNFDAAGSFRAYGLLVEGFNPSGPDDGQDVYVDFTALGPANVDQTLSHTTAHGDTGTATVTIVGDADAQGLHFSGRATGMNVGSSPQLPYLTSTGYTDMLYVFTVSEPTTVNVEALIETSDDDSTGFALFTFRTGDNFFFDHWIYGANKKLDMIGGNAQSFDLVPDVEYVLFLQTQAFNTSTSGETGWTDYSVTLSVPEPGSAVLMGAAALAAMRRRRPRRRAGT